MSDETPGGKRGRSKVARSCEGETVVNIDRWIRAIVLVMISAYVIVLLGDYHINYAGWADSRSIRRLFNITREDGLPSWVAVTQTIFVALTAWAIYLASRRAGASVWVQRGWLLIAAFFSYMAFDDGNRFHERVGTAFRESHGEGMRLFEMFPSYSWQFVFLPFFGAMGLFILYFLWRELRELRLRLFVALAIGCFVGAVGLDFIEGLDPDHPWNAYTRLADAFYMDEFTWNRFGKSEFDTYKHFSKAIEEVVEMSGTTLLWVVFLRHLARVTGDVHLRFVERPR